MLEVEVLSSVRQYVPAETVQTVLAVDQGTRDIFFKRFQGETLNEIRLRYHRGKSPIHEHPEELHYRTDEWFIGLDLRRASDVLAAYQTSSRHESSPVGCPKQKIHTFYHKRLQNHRRLWEFYGSCSPSFLESAANDYVSLEDFLGLPISIKGQSYGCLRHHLDRATQVLDPERPAGLQSLPCAFGFGDGHEGNVMVSLDSSPPSLLYTDYEVAGYHTPFLDLAKPIYLDGFFNAAYADLLCEKIPCEYGSGNTWVDWTIERERISIDYGLALEPLWKTLAGIKLEYILRPILEIHQQLTPTHRDTAEETLAYGLLCCALLTRSYSTRSDVFYLNLALGLRLATEMRNVFSEYFGWSNWPHGVLFIEEALPRETSERDNQQLILLNRERDALQGSRTELAHGLSHRSSSMESDMMMAGSYSNALEEHTRGVLLLGKIHKCLPFEIVFLKREEETTALHNKFSARAGEGAAVISQRIDQVRKAAMRVR